MSYGPSLTERSLVTVILFFLDQRVHTGASYDQHGTELIFFSIIYWKFSYITRISSFNEWSTWQPNNYEFSETGFSSSIKGTINIPALLQKYIESKTNVKNTVFWVFFPLRGEGKIWLQGRKVFVGRNIRNVVCHSCDNTRAQHTVCVLSFSVCLLYFSRCLPNDRETGSRKCEPTEPNR